MARRQGGPEYVDVFTDGACLRNGQKEAAAGIGVYFGDNHRLNVSRPISDCYRATNNVAQIEAVTATARQASSAGVEKLRINTDSNLLISCARHWMPNWKSHGWKTYDGRDVVNTRELMEMDRPLKPLDVVWNYTPGHSGVRGNNMADKLAKKGARKYRRL